MKNKSNLSLSFKLDHLESQLCQITSDIKSVIHCHPSPPHRGLIFNGPSWEKSSWTFWNHTQMLQMAGWQASSTVHTTGEQLPWSVKPGKVRKVTAVISSFTDQSTPTPRSNIIRSNDRKILAEVALQIQEPQSSANPLFTDLTRKRNKTLEPLAGADGIRVRLFSLVRNAQRDNNTPLTLDAIVISIWCICLSQQLKMTPHAPSCR